MDQTEMSTDLDSLLIPWDTWEEVKMDIELNKLDEHIKWCMDMKLEHNVDYTLYVSIDRQRYIKPVKRVYNWLFKDPKYAIMFRLRWQ